MGARPVICLGEALIDMVATDGGPSVGEATCFRRVAGGAPANLAVGLARLGIPSAFVGRVGDDPFGHFLARTLSDAGVRTEHLRFEARARTALAFVALDAERRPDYVFYRHPSADQMLAIDDVRGPATTAAILCAGSVLLSAEPAASALMTALRQTRAAGGLVVLDVNLRPALFRSQEHLRGAVHEIIRLAHVVKCNEDELAFITGGPDLDAGMAALLRLGPDLAIVTRGPAGAAAAVSDRRAAAEAFSVPVVDTTGSGDAFMAAVVAGLFHMGVRPGTIQDLDAEVLADLLTLGNAAGALATTAVGAIPALPRRESVLRFLASRTHRRVAYLLSPV